MKNNYVVMAIAILSLVCFAIAGQVHAESILYFTSSPSSWVGHGQTVTEPVMSIQQYHDQGAYTNEVLFKTYDWTLCLAAPNKSQFAVGSYPNATRWPFQGYGAGLSLFGEGRGDNTLTGHFEVIKADYQNGSLTSFAANFVQYDEGKADWWNSGYIHYNYTVPEPSTLALLLIATLGCLLLWRRHR